MNCIKRFRKLFRRGSSVPAIPTGNIDKSKKKLNKAASLNEFDVKKNIYSKKSITENDTMNKLNPEVSDSVDSDNEHDLISKQKSSTMSQMKNTINNINGHSTVKSNIEKQKSMIEYDTSETSSVETKNIYAEDGKPKNSSVDILLEGLSARVIDRNERNTENKDEKDFNTSYHTTIHNGNEEYRYFVQNQQFNYNPNFIKSFSVENNSQLVAESMQLNEINQIKKDEAQQINGINHSEFYENIDLKSNSEDPLKNKDKNSKKGNKTVEIFDEDTLRDKIRNSIEISQNEESNNLIKEQFRIIESLKQRCQELEDDLQQKYNNNDGDQHRKALKEEIVKLREINRRLNSELSYYQLKNPSIANQLKEIDSNRLKFGLPSDGPIPSWIVNTALLSPLIEAYDERLNEREGKNKQLRKKIDDLSDKLKILISENIDLQKKFEKIPIEYRNRISTQENKLSEWEQIKRHSQLVLLENVSLNEQIDLLQQKLNEIQNNNNQEKARLSKRLLLLESEKNESFNQMDIYKTRIAELEQQNNRILAETEKKIGIKEHLNEISELKKTIEKLNYEHKQEMDNILELLQTLQTEKTQLSLKMNESVLANKRFAAEIEVLERSIQEGTGRKVQRKLATLQKKLELAEIKEKTYICSLLQITKDMEKANLETESLKNLAKTHETQQFKVEKMVVEENVKIAKLEEKIETLKNKASSKLAKTIERLQRKELDFTVLKLENERKTSDILSLLQKKQDQIDKFLIEKKMIEEELNAVVNITSSYDLN